MGELEQWLPNAIQAGTAVGQLWLGLTGRRPQQAVDWAAMLEELAGLDGLELRRIVEENSAVAELIGMPGRKQQGPPARTSAISSPRSPPPRCEGTTLLRSTPSAS